MAFQMDIEEGVQHAPERILIYGGAGVGKTTTAANAPRPFVLDLDRGSARIDVARNRRPIETWEELLAAVRWFADRETKYQTLVLDTLDRAEHLCWQHVCRTGGKGGKPVRSIEDVGGGYQKGYTASYEEHRRLVAALEDVWSRRGMRIILLAHARLETVKNPDGPDYQRHTLKLDPRVTGLWWEAVDAVLYAKMDVVVTKEVHDEKRHRALASVGDVRVAVTRETPTAVAKNRYGLPETIPFSWDALVRGIAVGHSPELLKRTIADRLARIGDPRVTAAVERHLAEVGDDVKRLIDTNARLATNLAAKQRAAVAAAEAATDAPAPPGNGAGAPPPAASD